MKQIRKHLESFFFLYFIGTIVFYFIYLFSTKIGSTQKPFFSVIQSIINFPLFSKDGNSITAWKIILLCGLILISFNLARFISKKLSQKIFLRMKLDKGGIETLENLSFYSLLLFFFLISLNISSISLSLFTFIGGALAIGAGFGSQTLLSNFISGLIIQIERPIRVGDLVEIDGSVGRIYHIGLRSSKIRLTNNQCAIFSNNAILDKKLLNFTYQGNLLRSDIKIIVPIETDLNRLKHKIDSYLKDRSDLVTDPAPKILFKEFLDVGTHLSLQVQVWIYLNDLTIKNDIESELRFKIKELIYEQ